ncbi:unnamed protein product [Ranitomeya imitator]|uniref:Uncharacterized protein n=1 Tax=Ranitomeya imitator TaxID=111125 RepID=A0ABN9M1Z5_9NEOB|nr:unnamed protein product [Ranitomeya imitator]
MILFALAAAAWHWLLQDIVPVYQIKGISKLFKLCLPKVQCFCDSLTSPPSERQFNALCICDSRGLAKGHPDRDVLLTVTEGDGDGGSLAPCHHHPPTAQRMEMRLRRTVCGMRVSPSPPFNIALY